MCILGGVFFGVAIHDKHIEIIVRQMLRRVTVIESGDTKLLPSDLVDRVRELAREKGCTPAQLALAWLLARGEDVVPIPGTTRVARLEENVAAAEIALTPDDLARIDAVAPRGAAAGARYAETGMAMVGR